MNSIQKKIAVSDLTHAVAGVVKNRSGHCSPYIRLRLNPRDFAWASPEILYLDPSKHAAYVPRAETNPAIVAKIVALAGELADSIPRFAKPSSAPASLELEAEDLGGDWLVNIKVVTTLRGPHRAIESTHSSRVRCSSSYTGSLAA